MDYETVGLIVISLLPLIVGLLQAWASRNSGRTVKFRGKIGDEEIEFEGSAEELSRLLEALPKTSETKKEGKHG